MSAVEIAVLSYHGWEIVPDLLARDVATLRTAGWRDLSLDDLSAADRLRPGRYFHVTLDDGAEGDRECVAALRQVSCPVTLFVALDAMTAADRAACASLKGAADVAIEDHSLRHARTFHYRHVIGFHTAAQPLMTSPERLHLQEGDPVCSYGAELARPAFRVDAAVREWCRCEADRTALAPGSRAWEQALAQGLVNRGLAFRRFGRLCAAGAYETPAEFRSRITSYLSEGRERLTTFTGRPPVAFAHPWWEPGAEADTALQALGYRLTFSGRGMYRGGSRLAIPRIFVASSTDRPLEVQALSQPSAARFPALRNAARRVVFA